MALREHVEFLRSELRSLTLAEQFASNTPIGGAGVAGEDDAGCEGEGCEDIPPYAPSPRGVPAEDDVDADESAMQNLDPHAVSPGGPEDERLDDDAELKWRGKQKPGAIMKPSTFAKIKRKAAAAGADDPEKVAGAAYWRTVAAKHKAAKKKAGK